MEFKKKVTVHMADTDSTGSLYFTAMLRMAAETFEKWLIAEGVELSGIALPIVHAEADYAQAMHLWDHVEITLRCSHIGTTSFTIEGDIGTCGKTRIVHVVTDDSGNKCSIPKLLKNVLNSK